MLHIILLVTVLHLRNSESFPNSRLDSSDEDGDSVYYHTAEAEPYGRNGTECEQCVPDQCPAAAGCRAGLVLDRCGCCYECGNSEGQLCDLDNINVFYGLCGSDLQCKIDMSDLRHGEVLEPQCVCVFQEAVCASDGRTFLSLCQFKDAAYSQPGLRVHNGGPCQTVPLIKVPPHNRVNVSGSTVVFLCEVFAFPMALIEWRKEGSNLILPGDDPHISVQSRGGPMKYELSSWLQIEGVVPGDAGMYHCVAHNQLGNVSASAVLGVLRPEEVSAFSSEDMPASFAYDPQGDFDEDYY
ncbi:kazal-type serine peptidase inhibitor domain 3 [Brienomyrus brachyistius]|uniref:kazal-type serine peptidase inhibitor domain 3 n=1 Tax=Brienomyrus brachyistius TaxID=42636 RepID=UPI0020B1EAA9|nr:kazal-type serine peptidase inhibitor domain 3 [Brienomyrus brachyistius]